MLDILACVGEGVGQSETILVAILDEGLRLLRDDWRANEGDAFE